MRGLHSRQGQDLQRPFPGCMRSMVDVFDSSTDMGGTKFLTDIAHRDVSPSRRNQREVVKKTEDSLVVHLEDRPKTSELSSSSKKLGGTMMKVRIAQEMSKETASKKKPSNVVARLMGLDEALPTQEMPKGRADRAHPARVTLAGVLHDCRQQGDSNFGMPMPCGIHSCAHEETKCGDVNEVWQQPPRTRRRIKDQYLHKGRYDEIQSERRMALVRHKFMEAKQMATKERLLKTKEFEANLEVLSSNRDLSLKFLEEPNPLFSKHLKELHLKPAITQTTRITVLKPSWRPMTKGDKPKHLTGADSGLDFDKPQWRSSATQPTRIVVLKPTTTRHHKNDTKPIVTSHTSSFESIEKSGSYTDLESQEFIGSLGKDISHQTRENIGSHRRDESLLSSVFSNGYVGDRSSFSRSENEYAEGGANFSDSEIVTPTLRHSWDYVKRYGSPYSSSSFSQISGSPEPYVTREAKKRLSERCALVASKGFNREEMEVRISVTLGEMLATSEITEEVEGVQPNVSSSRSCGGEEDARVSIDCLPTSKTKYGDGEEGSTWNLSRSKSVPVSSSAHKNVGSISEISESQVQNNSEVPNSQVKKPIVPKEVAKSKSGKSSFKGKVSRLFFTRNQKTDKEKSTSSLSIASDDRIQYGSTEPSCDRSHNLLNSSHNSLSGDGQITSSEEESAEASTTKDGSEQGTRAALFLEKPSTPEFLGNHNDSQKKSDKTSQNQDQPSPTSVLDVPFEDDSASSNSCETSGAGRPLARIEEVARSLAWDDTNQELSSPSSSKPSRTSPEATEEESQRHLFVQSLLSAAGLGNEKLNAVFTRFHSVDSPLDPSLLDMFLDQKEEEAKKNRGRRSNLRFLFDCVNSALIDIDQITYVGVYPWARARNSTRKKVVDGILVRTEVGMLVSDWFSGEEKLASDNTDNNNTDLVVDRQVSRDISGSGWAEFVRSEIDGIGKEISGELLEDLVGEASTDFQY